jgi:hypothetical protein
VRRSTLSGKPFIAVLPLLLALAVLMALTLRNDLHEVRRAENGAALSRIWAPLSGALQAVDAEALNARAMFDGDSTNSVDDLARQRSATDLTLSEVASAIELLEPAAPAASRLAAAEVSLRSARKAFDSGIGTTAAAYQRAERDLLIISETLPAESADRELGGELLAVSKLARANALADRVITGITAWDSAPTDIDPLVAARQSFSDLESAIAEFESTAPAEWLRQYRDDGFATALTAFRSDLDQALSAVRDRQPASFDLAAFEESVGRGVEFQTVIGASIVERAETRAAAVRSESMRRVGITLGVIALASLLAVLFVRSITRHINAVTPRSTPSDTRRPAPADAHDQSVESLPGRVPEYFVTMVRRNRSLIDRQLALLDEYEIEDPELLARCYQLDHLATRMRRNCETLMVLAGAEPQREWIEATAIDDVVRAAIGEAEDYRSIEIEELEPVRVRADVVVELSHLIAELFDNATSFGSPGSVVRISGRRTGDSYRIRVVDAQAGIDPDRMSELNRLLREPPSIGLKGGPTLGMSVISLLAARLGIEVTLAAGDPGLTVDVALPSTLAETIELGIEPPSEVQTDEASMERAAADDRSPTAPDVPICASGTTVGQRVVDVESGLHPVSGSTVEPDDSDDETVATEPVAGPASDTSDRPMNPRPTLGEFDRTVAPPIGLTPIRHRPVAPSDAVAAPTRTSDAETPDVGPHRLDELALAPPSALEAALASGWSARSRRNGTVLPDEPPPVESEFPTERTASGIPALESDRR